MTPNARTVDRYMDAFRAGDRATILDCLTDDVEWYVPGAFRARGRDAFAEHILDPGFTGRPIITVTRTVEQGDVVVSEGTVRAPRVDAPPLDLLFCDVFELRDARIARLVSYLVMLPS